MAFEGWTVSNGCAVCPRCNRYVSCGNAVPAVLAAAGGHDCRAEPGTGHYLRPPAVPAEGWYWAEPDGRRTRIGGPGGLPAQNMANSGSQRGSSRFKGVSWDRARGKWAVAIVVAKRKRWLGRFIDETDAARAYDTAALAEWGQFARLNFPPLAQW